MEPVKYMGKRGQRQEQNTTSVTPPKKDRGIEAQRERGKEEERSGGVQRKEEGNMIHNSWYVFRQY